MTPLRIFAAILVWDVLGAIVLFFLQAFGCGRKEETMTTEEIQALHAKVWAFRADLADVWPTPDTLDSLRFAFTEAGEAMDAYLRTKGGYARNNVKEPDLFGELADCALMLFTALGPSYQFPPWIRLGFADLDSIAYDVGELLFDAWHHEGKLSEGTWVDNAGDTLKCIAAYPGMDLAAELDERMARIRSKHTPPAG